MNTEWKLALTLVKEILHSTKDLSCTKAKGSSTSNERCFSYPLMRLFTAARIDSEAKIFSGCVEIIFNACGIVGGVVGNQDTAPGFLGAGIMHNSPWQKNTWKMIHFNFHTRHWHILGTMKNAATWFHLCKFSKLGNTYSIGTIIRIQPFREKVSSFY